MTSYYFQCTWESIIRPRRSTNWRDTPAGGIVLTAFTPVLFAYSTFYSRILLPPQAQWHCLTAGIRFENLNSMSKQIWQWCETRNIWIFASYISSKENFEADCESRRLEPETEYELSNLAFSKIIESFGKPDIDLFASRTNHKCAKYVSWKQDPGSEAIDAFTLNWRSFYFYSFPPFSIILKVLRKIKKDDAEGIVVVPVWPAQPWYPLFQSMLVSKSIKFNSNKELLISCNREPHPLWKNLSLEAGRLSGKR